MIREFSGESALGQPYPFYFATTSAGYFANIIRMAIAIVFVGSFVVQPFVMRPLSLLWRRIVESDKPIFTLLLGGIASGVVLVNEVGKHL